LRQGWSEVYLYICIIEGRVSEREREKMEVKVESRKKAKEERGGERERCVGGATKIP